ncbi:MAG: carboxylesterase family protein [Lachnospiraceae bacterium]|nr:carboxylesterase family protein [Lachnospiraceae bacterium]
MYETSGVAEDVSSEDANGLTVKVVNGIFTGTVEDNGVYTWKGIPYAKAPVGDLRWKAPEAVEASDEKYDAARFGYSCPQYEWPSEPASYNEISEDCLTLNVWASDVETADKPVMIYFHGGGYAWGGTSDPLYNGKNFVKEYPDIIMVSANYRVGMYGFIDFSDVPGGEDFPDSSRLGILDQLQSIRWVKDNIEAFGGDPNNITIFGESAGAGTISAILTMDFEDDLFQRAIIESGSLAITNDKEGYETVGLTEALLERSGAENMDDLMAIPEKELIDIYFKPDEEDTTLNDMVVMPLRDGNVIPLDGYSVIKEGKNKNIDVMVGSNANEFNYWIEEVAMGFETESIEDAIPLYQEYCLDPKVDATISFFNDEEKNDLEKYWNSLPEDMDHVEKYTEFINDIVFRVPSVKLAECHADAGGNSYVYYFAKESTNPGMGACHASELAYVFNSPDETIFSGEVDTELAKKMSNMWANFARTGNPSIEGFTWEKFDTDNRKTLVIGNDSSLTMEEDPLGEQREYMEDLVKWGHIQNNY